MLSHHHKYSIYQINNKNPLAWVRLKPVSQGHYSLNSTAKGFRGKYINIFFTKQMNDRERIGLKIALLRKNAGLTQRHLAERSGFTQKTICKVETGQFSVGIDTLSKIADALGYTVDIIKK